MKNCSLFLFILIFIIFNFNALNSMKISTVKQYLKQPIFQNKLLGKALSIGIASYAFSFPLLQSLAFGPTDIAITIIDYVCFYS